MLKVVLIRHFATKGNLERRYIGITDESIEIVSDRKGMNRRAYPEVEKVFSSPLKRCLETAALIYPDDAPEIVSDLRECNFGIFENKNYKELRNHPDYQAFIDSGGTLDFPGGEGIEEFKKRTQEAFLEVIEQSIHAGLRSVALVVHGGTIMSILDRYSSPHQDYYSWQVKNGEGYEFFLEKKNAENGRRLPDGIFIACPPDRIPA